MRTKKATKPRAFDNAAFERNLREACAREETMIRARFQDHTVPKDSLVETISMFSAYTYAIGMIIQHNINKWLSHCCFFFTGVLELGFLGAAGGILGIDGGVGG